MAGMRHHAGSDSAGVWSTSRPSGLTLKIAAGLIIVASLAGVSSAPATAAPGMGASSGMTARGQTGGYATGGSSPLRDRIVEARVRQLTMLPFDQVGLRAVPFLVAPSFVQHDSRVADGVGALTTWIAAYRRQHPAATISIKRVLVDHGLAMVQANVIDTPGTRGTATADIYRVDALGRVLEHWNTSQDVPATTASGNDMFSTASSPQRLEPDPRVRTAVTRAVAQRLYDIGGIDVKDELSQLPYYQHSTQLPNGTAALGAIFSLFPDLKVTIKRVIVQNDYIAFHTEYVFAPGAPAENVLDMWRVQNGKLVEHWDVISNVPATSANGNGSV